MTDTPTPDSTGTDAADDAAARAGLPSYPELPDALPVAGLLARNPGSRVVTVNGTVKAVAYPTDGGPDGHRHWSVIARVGYLSPFARPDLEAVALSVLNSVTGRERACPVVSCGHSARPPEDSYSIEADEAGVHVTWRGMPFGTNLATADDHDRNHTPADYLRTIRALSDQLAAERGTGTLWYLAGCRDCRPKLMTPFLNREGRDGWAEVHRAATGHQVDLFEERHGGA